MDDRTWSLPAAFLVLSLIFHHCMTCAFPAAPTPVVIDDNRPIRLRDVANEAGVSFQFDNGSRGKHDLVEIMGGGVALIDADGDGYLDIYLCNGGPIEPKPGQFDPPCRLFLSKGGWHFQDVTDRANAPGPSYAMGAAVGDFDSDGRDDLFVTGWRDQRLYRNVGGGRFEDVTERAGLRSDTWSTSAAFADLDNDGDLDLYVCNYVEYEPSQAPFCAAPDGKRDYCGPEVFKAQTDRLYRNNGDRTFSDVSTAAGVADPDGRALGVLIADFDIDGRLDIYVANDGTACRLYRNLGGLKFEDIGEKRGVAHDEHGHALAGMGVAWGDVNGDERPDLFVANYRNRGTIGFMNRGMNMFSPKVNEIGLTPTREVLGFGLALADFDGDGDLDLLQANGHVLDRARLNEPFEMRGLVLRNEGGRFVDASSTAGQWFSKRVLGRGLAIGDLDNDGKPDAVIVALDAPVAVLRNESSGQSVRLDLVPKGETSHSLVGTRLRATIGGRTVVREVIGGGSYLSASSPSVCLGLAAHDKVDRIEVSWRSGFAESWTDLVAQPVIRLEEGRGD